MNPQVVLATLIGILLLACSTIASPSASPSEGAFGGKWGTEGMGDGQFNWPAAVAVASDGSVYVADTFNHRIQKFTSAGVFVSKWGTLGAGDGQFDYLQAVAVA